MAIMNYFNKKKDGSVEAFEVHYYVAREWSGEPRATDEMGESRWFDSANMPYEEMLPSDEEVFSRILAGKKLRGEVWRDTDGTVIPGSLVIEELQKGETLE